MSWSVELRPVAVTREQAAAMLGMGLTSFESYVQPHIRIIRRGKLRLVPVKELEQWCDENAEAVFAKRNATVVQGGEAA